jgi:hypothetical protein
MGIRDRDFSEEARKMLFGPFNSNGFTQDTLNYLAVTLEKAARWDEHIKQKREAEKKDPLHFDNDFC